MKTRPLHLPAVFFVAIGLAFLLPLLSFGQDNPLEDAPFRPSGSVVKGSKAALSDSSVEVVAFTVRAFADWREEDLAPEAIKLLTPETPRSVRIEVLRYFARLGPKAKTYIAEILKQSGDPDPNIRAAVLGVLLASQASAEHLDAIGMMLKDPRNDVRIAAALCLGQAGGAAAPQRQALLDALKNAGTDEFRAATLQALAQIGGLTPEVLEQIKPYLRSRDPEVRVAAWVAFGKGLAPAKNDGAITEEEFEATRAEFLPVFEAQPPEVKAAIHEGLRGDMTTLQTFLPGLTRDIETGTPEMKAASLHALGEAGDAALDQLPLILEQAKNPNDTVRSAAIGALGSLGPAAVRPNMAVVANALLDESPLVRDEALRALPAGGEAAATFPYRIADVYPTASPGVRETLVKAVPIRARLAGGLDDDGLARGRAAMADPDSDVRIGIAYVMGQLGAKYGSELLLQFLPLLKAPQPAVRGATAISLRSFATDASAKQKLRAELRPLLEDQDAEVRWAALDTLHELDPGEDPELVDGIAVLVNDLDQPVRSAAVRALGAAGPVAKKHLQEVVEFFLDDPAVPPFGAAETVLQISPLNPQELTSLLYPLYVYPELTTLTRATAYAASGGDTDGLLIASLLGRSRVPAKDVVDPADVDHVVMVLEESLKAPLMHDTLKVEIEGRIAEIKALR